MRQCPERFPQLHQTTTILVDTIVRVGGKFSTATKCWVSISRPGGVWNLTTVPGCHWNPWIPWNSVSALELCLELCLEPFPDSARNPAWSL